MPLIYIGEHDKSKPAWFAPDRLNHVRHNAGSDCNMRVFDAHGVLVWGRIVDNSEWWWEYTMRDYVWVPFEPSPFWGRTEPSALWRGR